MPTAMPEYDPLYPKLPYEYENYTRLSVYGNGDEDAIATLLPEPLTAVSGTLEAFILSAPSIAGLDGYTEGGIVVQARYKDTVGAHMLAEFVTKADALAAGREIWGYPKKLCDVGYDERDDGSRSGHITMDGVDLIRASFEPADVDFEVPQLFPRLQVKRIPSATGDGCDVNQIVKMGFSGDKSDFDADSVHEQTDGTGQIEFPANPDNPFVRIGPVDTIGAAITKGDFTLSHGEILADLND